MSAHGQLEEKSQSKQEEELDESKDKENNDLKLECDVCGLYANETPEKNLYYCNLCANGNKLSEFRILCMKHGIDTHGRRSTHKFEKLNIKLANKSFNEPIQVANDYKEKFHNAVVLYTESKLKGEKETQKAIEKIKKSFTQVTKHSYVTDGLATTAVMVADGLTTADGAVYSTAGVNMTMEFLQSNHFPVTTETSAESVASFGTCAQDVLVNKISLICYPIVFGLEALYFGYKYCSGKISSKEFFYRLTKSVLRAGGAIGSSYGIVAAGIAMGVFAGPVGLIVGGIIGAIAGGAIVSYSCEKIWKWATKKWPWLMKSERTQKQIILDAALDIFNLSGVDLKDKHQFNKEIIRKTYKDLAKTYHPDRANGRADKFREIHAYYGMLLELVDENQSSQHKDDCVELVRKLLPAIE